MDACTNMVIDARERRGTSSQIVAPFAARSLDPRRLGAIASWALREEATLTPKPGLVDRRGSGAHADMGLALLLRSAAALEPHFVRLAECASAMSCGAAMRARLGVIGREAEADMLAATGGINTHRGAIWALGLLVAAIASATAESATARRGPHPVSSGSESALASPAICARAARIARLPTVACASTSHGSAMRDRYGVRGARGEAENAFPHIQAVALPALRAARARCGDERSARLQALIALIARLDDTCLLYRGGAEALAFAQCGARRVLDYGLDSENGRRALDELDRGLLARNASPGGSADLFAATLLLDRIESPNAGALHIGSLRVESLDIESFDIASVAEKTDGNT